MNRRDIVIGVVVLVLVIGAVLWVRSRASNQVLAPSPVNEEQIENSFNLMIPEDLDKAELRDVASVGGSGIATKKYENGTFSHMILADLPGLEVGTFYEGWLLRGKMGDANFASISTGKLVVAKGGYLLEFQSGTDYSDYTSVVVTLEKVNDGMPETFILEGSF